MAKGKITVFFKTLSECEKKEYAQSFKSHARPWIWMQNQTQSEQDIQSLLYS